MLLDLFDLEKKNSWIISCVPQKKKSHSGLEQHEAEKNIKVSIKIQSYKPEYQIYKYCRTKCGLFQHRYSTDVHVS